jgi:hypothetical protein
LKCKYKRDQFSFEHAATPCYHIYGTTVSFALSELDVSNQALQYAITPSMRPNANARMPRGMYTLGDVASLKRMTAAMS